MKIPLIACGLILFCMVALADCTEAAVDKPSEPGPYKVGYANVTYPLLGETEPEIATYYYPATTDGINATPDTSGAPYPTVFWFWYPGLDNETVEDIRYLVASHGMVFVNNRGQAHLRYPNIIDRPEFDYAWSSMMDTIESLDGNLSSPLYGMIDQEAYGISGWMDGYYGAVAAADDGRGDAFALLSPTPGEDETGYLYWTGPTQIQQAEFNHELEPYTKRAYPNTQSTVKSEVTIYGADIYNGSYDLGLYMAFLLYYLDGKDEYRTFLYGEDAIQGTTNMLYDLKFEVSDDEFFPPDVSIVPLIGPVYMETLMRLDLEFTGYPDLNDSAELTVNWSIKNSSNVVIWVNGSMEVEFPAPEEYKVTAKWMIREYFRWSTPYYITVENMPPIADAGPNRTVTMDEEVVFDGGLSWDTPTHLLVYRWSFSDGEVTEYSNISTHTKTLTEVGLLEATLTVRDPMGAEAIASCDVIVDNVAPTVTTNVKTRAHESEVIPFSGWGTDTASHFGSLMYKWDYDDGSTTEWSYSSSSNHTYKAKGKYEVTLWVKDLLDVTGNDTVLITIDNVVPSGGIVRPADGVKASIDSKLDFVGWGRDTPSDNGSLWYLWDFGDGRTAGGAEASHAYKEAGRYTITLTVEDNDGATAVVNHTLTIEAGPILDGPVMFTVTVGFLAMLLVALAAATEPGKYWIGLLGGPLFVKTEDVLDNKTRHALLGIIVTNPGIHYSAIKEEFELANGAAAHHLHVLEREGFIRSARDGKLKRFYLADVKVPEGVGMSPEDTRDAMVEIVRERPGISQLEIMEELGLERNEASYYLRTLVKEDRLEAGKEGRFTVYTVKRRK
jgi:predicted transcriptional regulator